MTFSELVRSLADECQQQVDGKHVLAISDTSEVNLEKHRNRLKPEGVGVVGNNVNVGFFIHPTLILDAENGFPLGLSTVQMWSRPADRPTGNERKHQSLPIEDKESYKWIASAEQSQRCLQAGNAKLVTHIGDREADIYEEWATVADGYNHLLVRVKSDRQLFGQSQSLYPYLSSQPCQGSYSLKIDADPRRNRQAREALLNVRFTEVEIQRAKNFKSTQELAKTVKLYAIEALEICLPKGQEPIHWRLMTTHEVMTLEQALKMIQRQSKMGRLLELRSKVLPLCLSQ